MHEWEVFRAFLYFCVSLASWALLLAGAYYCFTVIRSRMVTKRAQNSRKELEGV